MSLLSDTQGRPERVFSLLRLLSSLGGRAPKEELLIWMMPASFRKNEKSVVQVIQTIGCARSLAFVKDDGSDVVLELEVVPSDPLAFGDLVHERLRDAPSDADRVLLLTYACVVLETARHGTTNWLNDQSAEAIASQINSVLEPGAEVDAYRSFNSTKYPYWRSWMIMMGLGFEAGTTLPSFFPQPADRLAREVRGIAQKYGTGVEIPARTFMDSVAERMPYLDGGKTFENIANRSGWHPREGWVSNVLSEALRDLHDDGTIELIARSDASDTLSLAQEVGSPLKSFVGVILREGDA